MQNVEGGRRAVGIDRSDRSDPTDLPENQIENPPEMLTRFGLMRGASWQLAFFQPSAFSFLSRLVRSARVRVA